MEHRTNKQLMFFGRGRCVRMLAVLYVIFATLVVLAIVGIYQKSTNAVCKSNKRLDGKTVIVTGGTTGMGLWVAVDFANRGARVTVACPFLDEGLEGRKTIINETGNDNVVFKLLDLSSLNSVREFAADILRTESRLDILVNNAGAGAIDNITTADGISVIMQVNYFGHFLLTLLLLPLLKKSGTNHDPSRVMNTSSIANLVVPVDINKINGLNVKLPFRVYGKSKLCLILFANELSKKLRGTHIVITSIDPGAVGTTIFDCGGKLFGTIMTYLCCYLFKTPQQGAQTAIHVALDREAGAVSGEFFKNRKMVRARRAAHDDKLSAKLWEESLRLVKLTSEDVDDILLS